MFTIYSTVRVLTRSWCACCVVTEEPNHMQLAMYFDTVSMSCKCLNLDVNIVDQSVSCENFHGTSLPVPKRGSHKGIPSPCDQENFFWI